MGLNQIEVILSKMTPRLYAFAFALFCHRGDAEKFVFDTLFFMKKDLNILKLFSQLEDLKNKEDLLEYPFKIQIEAFKILYKMAEIKLMERPYAEGIFKVDMVNYGTFFSLEYRERAILFLKYREHLDSCDMSFVLGLGKTDMISQLVMAKNHLSEVVSL